MNTDLELMKIIQDQKVREWMKEATIWRQLKSAPVSAAPIALHCRLLAATGRVLTQVGIWLQKRYGRQNVIILMTERENRSRAYG